MDVVVADRDAHRIGGDGHALDQDVRVVAQDVAVLEGARLAFVGIADQVLLARELRGMKLHFKPGRKARAAAAAQRRLLDFGDDLFRRDFLVEDLAQRRVAAALLVVFRRQLVP